MDKTKTVVIVGRVNVGKSAIFNYLTDSNEAIISSDPGTTCDRKCGLVAHEDKLFKLVDTGGVNLSSLKDSILALAPRKTKIEILSVFKGALEKAIVRQTKAALKEADLLLMVCDSEQGLHPGDEDLALVLKKINKPKILVCNKTDKPCHVSGIETFRQLELGEPIPVSALNLSGQDRRGRDSLLKLLIDKLNFVSPGEISRREKSPTSEIESKGKEVAPIRIVMIGRTGVGKSSLFNKILGKELAVVSDVCQTTTDSNNGSLPHGDRPILLTDTPGLLEKRDTKTDLDKILHQKTVDILKKADAVLFVTDVKKSLCSIDQYLAHLVNRANVPTVIVANKWDIFPRKDKEMVDQINIHYRNYLPKLSAAPIVFTSARTGEGTKKILEYELSPLFKK